VLEIGVQIAQTLDKLHKLNLIHGGVELNSLCFKSQNTLVLKPPLLQRAIDEIQPAPSDSVSLTERQYLASEANNGLTPATDFYELGILIYQLLFGLDTIDKFDSDTIEKHIIKSEHKNLAYLFKELLNRDAGQRIHSADQFTAALEHCGFVLKDKTSLDNQAISNQQNDKAIAKKAASRSILKWGIPAIGVTAAAITGAFFFLLPQDEVKVEMAPISSIANEAVNTSKTEITIGTINRASAGPAKVEGVTGFNKLYDQALDQIKINPKVALMIIEVALKYRPENIEALNLKNRIELQIEIETLLDAAENQIMEGHLVNPKGDNAYETYQNLAKLLSPDNEHVLKGILNIADIYYALSEDALENNQLEKALEYADLGLLVKADYTKLQALKSRIIEHQEYIVHNEQLHQKSRELLLRNKKYTDELIHTQLGRINENEQPSAYRN
jgi:hypothetical protein